MRLLLFSDLHRDTTAAENLLARAGEVDVLVGAGDFANMHSGLKDCLMILKSAPKPVVLVPGNNETPLALLQLCEGWNHIHILHGAGLNLGGLDFYGVGGGIPRTPFGSWSYDFDEAQATTLLAGCPLNSVLITHSPPKGAVDRNAQGESLGSTSIRDCILRTKPRLAVCGHVHGLPLKRSKRSGIPQ